MGDINRVEVRIVTGDRARAGTAEQVMLGLGGQEFALDSMANDFQRGSDRTYVLGEDANISSTRKNDPRRLSRGDVEAQPVYLRIGRAVQAEEKEETRSGKGTLADIINRTMESASEAGAAVRHGLDSAADSMRTFLASGDWNLEEVTVTVYPDDGAPLVYQALGGDEQAWLGGRGQPTQLVLTRTPGT